MSIKKNYFIQHIELSLHFLKLGIQWKTFQIEITLIQTLDTHEKNWDGFRHGCKGLYICLHRFI